MPSDLCCEKSQENVNSKSFAVNDSVCGEIRRNVIIEIIVSQNYLSFGVLKSVVKVNVPLYHLASGEVKVPHHATRSVENSCR